MSTISLRILFEVSDNHIQGPAENQWCFHMQLEFWKSEVILQSVLVMLGALRHGFPITLCYIALLCCEVLVSLQLQHSKSLTHQPDRRRFSLDCKQLQGQACARHALNSFAATDCFSLDTSTELCKRHTMSYIACSSCVVQFTSIGRMQDVDCRSHACARAFT